MRARDTSLETRVHIINDPMVVLQMDLVVVGVQQEVAVGAFYLPDR